MGSEPEGCVVDDANGLLYVGEEDVGIWRFAAGPEAATDATHIDRLNIGPIPTSKLNWLQPHEGNIIDFLFRSRAYQVPDDMMPSAS